jgi:hypothetical protein
MIYKLTVSETTCSIVEVEANSQEEAREKYEEGNVISEDVVDRTVEVDYEKESEV